MTKEEIKNTLYKLENDLWHISNLTSGYDEIRVRIGRRLATQIMRNFKGKIYCYADEVNTIMGYPLEIEYENDMCLEILTVTKVPLYKGMT